MAETDFRPIWGEDTLRRIIGSYKRNPKAYTPSYTEKIQQHADYHGVPFYTGEFSIGDALSDLGKGFFEGFTTLSADDPPDNEYEAIFRNIGHLFGFAPGIMAAPLSGAAKLSAKLGIKSTSLLTAAGMARKLNDYSVPMFAAKWATKGAKKLAKPFLKQGRNAQNSAVNTAANFILGNKARHIAEGAFHLGTASAVSSWQGGVDQMMTSFVHGGVFGGVFRGMGNIDFAGSRTGNKVVRSVAGSMFMGLPETMRGATTPEQIHQYLMGAWFGGQERPWTVKRAGEFTKEYAKEAETNEALRAVWEPEAHPKFEKLPEEVKPVVKEMFIKSFQTKEKNLAIAKYLAEQEGLDLEKIEKAAIPPTEEVIEPKVPFKEVPKEIPLQDIKGEKLLKEEEVEISNLGSTNEDNVGITPITDTVVGKRASNIVKYNIPDIFKDVKSNQERQEKTDILTNKFGNILEKHMTKKTGIATNESATVVQEMQDILAKDYNYQIKNSPKDPERVARFEGNIRQWLGRKNNDEPVEVLSTDGRNIYTLTQKNPKNRAGIRKVTREPYKLIDRAWQELTGKEERASTFLDHIIVEGEFGKKELSLSKFRQSEYAEYGGKADYNKLVSDTMKKMDGQGFYYWGGKGTKDRLYFTKHHPDINKLNIVSLRKHFKASDIDNLRGQFNEKYGVSGKYFDKAFVSNVLWTLKMNGMEYNDVNMKKITGDGFLSDVISFNKRLPLWMTDSYTAEKEYFTDPKSPGYISDLTESGNFKVIITPDFHQDKPKKFQDEMKEKSKYSDVKSTDTPEHGDGGVTGRNDVVKALNLESGNPESRTNKSLIISPDTELGALLAKYAIHPAGKVQSNDMMGAGIHLEISASSAKQMGLREFNTIYELDPTHIYQDYGIKQSNKFIKPQTIKKQLLTNLVGSLAKTSVTKDGVTMDKVIDDIIKTTIEPRFLGTKEGKESLDAYLDKLTTASNKELAEEFDKLDFDKIGLGDMVKALNVKGNQLYVNKVYEMLLLNRKTSLKEDLESRDISDEQYESGIAELEEYNSSAQRMISASRRDALKRGKPENQAGIFTNPDINSFREKLLSSYIIGQATKPKINNSAAAIIRPYDRSLQIDADNVNPRLKDLNKNNTLFFTGDMHKKTMIESELYGWKSLEELWKLYETKGTPEKAKKELEEIFRAAVIRVPSDSTSGTQILKFSGFTGRNDYGILMHGLKMRALGGADTDIDSAYIYFGGKGGFKKSWKDIIEANVDEFYEKQPNGRYKIAGNKAKEFQDKLIQKHRLLKERLLKSKAAMFSPNTRLDAAQGANIGRDLLGGAAVNPKNILASAYETIVRKGSDKFTVEDYKGNIYDVELIPKTSAKEKTYINKLMRSMMGFSSDAMDYGEPTGYRDWYIQALKAHFTIKSSVPNIIKRVGLFNFKQGGIIGMFNKANSAYYGKDYTKDRQWTMEDRRNMTKDLMLESDEHIRTITPRIARLLHGIDYSDNSLRKIDATKLKNLFDTYNKNIKQYDALKVPLGRRTFKAGPDKYINRVLNPKYNLLDPDSLQKVAESDTDFTKIIEGTPFEYEDIKGAIKGRKTKFIKKAKYDLEGRIRVLNRMKERAGAFAMREIQTLITVQGVSEFVESIKKAYPNLKTSDINKLIENASRKADWLKTHNYLMRNDRNSLDEDIVDGKQKKFKSKGTAELDQNEADKEIRQWKKNKTPLEKKLFDTLLLGSLNRGKIGRLDELNAIKTRRDLRLKERLEYNKELKNTARTSSSMLGYNSNALEKGSLDKFLGEMNNVYSEISEQRAPEIIRQEGVLLATEPSKQENIEKGFPEGPNKELEIFFTTKTGWEGVKEAKDVELDPETKSYVDDIISHLKTMPNNKVSQNFHLLVRDVIGKDLNIMNKQDWFVMKNWLDDIKSGTIWQRWKKYISNEDYTKLSQRHYMQFSETISKELMRDEIKLMQKEGIFLTGEGKRRGKVAKPTQFFDVLQRDVSLAMDTALGMNDDLAYKKAKSLRFLDGLPDNQALWEVAMATRERGMVEKILSDIDNVGKNDKQRKFVNAKMYSDLYNDTLKAYNYEALLKNKNYNVTIDKDKVQLTGEKVVERINEIENKFYEEQHKLTWGDVELDINKNILEYTTKAGNDVHVLQNSISKGIKGFTSGPKNSGYIIKPKEFPEGFYDPDTRQNPVIDIPKFVNDMKRWVAKGNKFPMEFGIDGMNTIARSMMYEMGRHNMTKKEQKVMFNTFPKRTGKIDYNIYYPHLHFDKKTAIKGLKKYAEALRKSELTPDEQDKLIKKLTYRYHSLTGEWNFEDIESWNGFNKAMESIGDAKTKKDARIDWVKSIRKAGPQFTRDGHIPGYSFDRQVPVTYGKSLINTYFRQLAQIFSRDTINKFEQSMFERKVEEPQRKAWSNFAKLWVQGAIGNPDVVPEYIYENPNMKIKGTPYGWWADNRVKDRLNKIGETLGLLKENIPENLRGLDLNDVKRWSNIEARFELATLLAHPRSMVNNIFGGTLHTIQSVGLRTFLNARNDKFMGTINEKWSSKHGRDTMAVRHGIYPEQLMEEYALNPNLHTTGNKSFLENLAKKLIRDPDISSESVRDLAKKSEVTKPIIELAAKFMSVPERALRRDAFMSHYLYWYNRLGGAIRDFDHPVLVELAKKGVKATQFLYSAPFRPMFARTALGKVMTRFQMWGWNAVRFRKEALRQARIYGFKGAEADRAARIMQLDLFVFALGNAFTYSLFESALPAPWNWVQDTSEWIFGDEKERNRAFFGQWPRAIAPLQMITPPLARMPLSAMRAILEDDWSRVADHYIYTMFPFGRIAKDFVGPRNLIENPTNLIDKWTGIPLIALSRKSKEFRKEE